MCKINKYHIETHHCTLAVLVKGMSNPNLRGKISLFLDRFDPIQISLIGVFCFTPEFFSRPLCGSFVRIFYLTKNCK